MSLECLLNTELPPLSCAIVTFARWGPGRHHAGTATRSVHRVQSERAQCVLPCDEYKRCLEISRPGHQVRLADHDGYLPAPQPAPTTITLTDGGTLVTCFRARRLHIAGARRVGRPGSLPPSE